MIKDNQISKFKDDLEELKKQVDAKTVKLTETENERKSLSQKLGNFDALMAKKSCEIIHKETENNALKRINEDLKKDNETLQDEIKNNVALKTLKEAHEREKWENLAKISMLNQQVEALKVKCDGEKEVAKELKEYAKKFAEIKKANDELKKELTSCKKDREIKILKRKLEKSYTEIRKLGKYTDICVEDVAAAINTHNEDNTCNDDQLSKLLQCETPPRFAILTPTMIRKRRQQQRDGKKNKVSYRKLGSLSYCGNYVDGLAKKPVLSFSIKADKQEERKEAKLLSVAEITLLEDILETTSLQVKRKRSGSPQPSSLSAKKTKKALSKTD